MSASIRSFALIALLALTAPLMAMSYTTETVNGKTCDVVGWTDANGKARSVALVRANGDINGYKGGYIERYSYYIGNTLKTGMSNEGQAFVSGLGCVVNHYASTASSSKSNTTGATTAFILQGANHCIWRFSGTYSPGAAIGLKLDYVISEGVNDIVWAVSFDSSGVANNAVNADARGPYVQWDWDNDGNFYNGPIAGIRWGDKYRFRTVNYVFNSPATTTWDYTQPNTIPYMAVNKSVAQGDIEVGAVQTQSWAQQDAGGYWWSSHWGQTGTGMPENWNCPYQLNAYENYAGEKLAWGTNFGYVGSSAYDELGFGAKRVGWPHQGYSVMLVVDRFSDGHLDNLIGSMEAAQATTVSATVGSVVTSGPRHLALTGDATYQPAGWNHVHGAWSFTAASSDLTANFAVGAGKTLVRPLISLGNYTATAVPAVVKLNNVALVAGTDYAATLDDAGNRLWLTLKRNLTGATNALSIADTGGTTVPTLTWPAPGGITYGVALTATQLNATANVAGSFSYTPAAGTVLHVGAGQTLSVTFSPTDSATYASASTTTTISVAKAPLTIRADDKTKATGVANPPLTASYTGFVNGDGAGALSTPPTLATTATTGSAVGTYPITASGAADADYTFTYQAGTMTVTAAGTAPPPAAASGGGGGGCGSGGLAVFAALVGLVMWRAARSD